MGTVILHPLRTKALAVIITICLLGLTSVGASFWFAIATKNDAHAINVSGSLRMQSWRLSEQIIIPELTDNESLALLIEIYDGSINNPSLSRLQERHNELGRRYRMLQQEWFDHMRPLLLSQDSHEQFLKHVPDYVDRIDALVNALQKDSEQKLRQLFIFALLSLCSILGIGLLAIRFIQDNLLTPVEALGEAAEQVQAGQFNNLQLNYRKPNELGRLTDTFTRMAKELERLYGDLEAQVHQQTRSLQISNTALQLLYDASQTIGVNPYDRDNIKEHLEHWKNLLDLRACYICANSNAGKENLRLINPDKEVSSASCQIGQCDDCKNRSTVDYDLPLMFREKNYGFLRITSNNQPLSEDSLQWMKTFSDIVATSLYRSSYQIQEHRLLLMEERSVIARELHDSLAQSLSFQQIQVARLSRQLKRQDNEATIRAVVDELKDGITSAYRQLRELLNTFRLNISEGSLEEALQGTLDEFRKRSDHIRFELDYQLRYFPLDAHQQIHILQIVREALVNVIKHSGATVARISCLNHQDSEVHVFIDDNGNGFPQKNSNPVSSSGHYGTTIMQERAMTLGGTLVYTESPSGGARVSLRFAKSV